jgi:hypothetical protein
MRVLLDECLPRKLKHDVRADFVSTVPEMGWAREWLVTSSSGARFRCLSYQGSNLEYQQNLATLDLAVIVLIAPTNDIEDLKPLMDAVNETIVRIKPAEVKYIGN